MILSLSRPDASEPERLSFDKPEIVLGKQTDCDIVLSNPKVSRRHARIAARNGGLYVEDLGSTNGTLLNGRPVDGERRLAPGDVIEVGPFRVAVEAGAPAAAPAGASATQSVP
ncbi:MAG: FHA domain-containing protein, partial [Candidatus Binatia bacterium]